MNAAKLALTYLTRLMGGALLVIGVNGIGQNSQPAPRELIYLNWVEYSDRELIAAFEKRFQVKIKQVYFESEDQRDRLLVEKNGKGFDIVNLSERVTVEFIKLGWLEKLNQTKLPNLKHLDPQFSGIREGIDEYVVPNMWGTIGIIYRRDLVAEEITSWKQLFQPAPFFKDKIIMLHDTLEVISLAFRSLGYTLNDYNKPEALQHVEEVLLRQSSFVKSFGILHIGDDSLIISGDVVMALGWNGDAMSLHKLNPNIAYVVPAEGTNLWIDFHAILSQSENKELAYAFINYLHDPANAAHMAQTLHYATTNKSAIQHLPPEFLEDSTIFPRQDILSKSAFLPRLPPRTIKSWNHIFAKIKPQ